MDIFASATLLAFFVIALVELAKVLFPQLKDPINTRWLGLTIIVAGLVDVHVVAHAGTWATHQVIFDVSLSDMNEWQLIITSVVVMGYAMMIYKLLDKSLPNIGQNFDGPGQPPIVVNVPAGTPDIPGPGASGDDPTVQLPPLQPLDPTTAPGTPDQPLP